jgi:hypothetical protein
MPALLIIVSLFLLLSSCYWFREKPIVDPQCQMEEEMIRVYAQRMHRALEDLHTIEDQVSACLNKKKKKESDLFQTPPLMPRPAPELPPG